MLPNTPPMYEAHFGVPMCGAVLNALNTRLDARSHRLHARARRGQAADHRHGVLRRDRQALQSRRFRSIDVEDAEFEGGERLGDMDYEAFLATGDPEFAWRWPEDEWEAIALNYTSGTTGNPKGVVYHHRGAYLNAVCNIVTWGMPHHSVYLWTLPMFHCNGWSLPLDAWRPTPGRTSACARSKRRRSSS